MSVLPLTLRSGLRRHALALKTERPRGHLPLRVWAGDPCGGLAEGTAVRFDADGHNLDTGDRLEITLALANAVVETVPEPVCWVTRSGSPDLCPSDLAWLAASHRSWHELGLTPAFVVVTREGWTHHPSGAEQRWRRLRDQS